MAAGGPEGRRRDSCRRSGDREQRDPRRLRSSMNDILLVAAIVAFVGAFLALVLVRGSDFVTYGPPQPEAER